MCKTETKTPPKPSTTPSSSQPTSGVTPPCHPACTLASQTIATSPANRARTKIGVGEEVKLTVTGNPATWAITSGTGKLSPSTGTQSSVTFTADDNAGSVTITATGSGCSCTNTITLNVIQPSDWTQKLNSGTKTHKAGRPHVGWKGTWYVHPNDVNFYRIQFREMDSQYVGTGSYISYTGDWHGNYPLPERASSWFTITMTNHTNANGSKVNAVDSVDTGDPGAAVTGAAPPFKKGSGYFPITMQWRVGTGTAKSFAATRQEDEIFDTGLCESRKGGETVSNKYNDP
ncbi:MAG: hypothetical protein ABJA66_08580, partial [Actinomycetota bacterium]